jgi:hypothetical protein
MGDDYDTLYRHFSTCAGRCKELSTSGAIALTLEDLELVGEDHIIRAR